MSSTNLYFAIRSRRFVPCLYIVLVSLSVVGIFNSPCFGQDTTLLRQQRCPHGEQRDKCPRCYDKMESFDKGRKTGGKIRDFVSPPAHRAGAVKAARGRYGAVIACIAMVLIFLSDNIEIVSCGLGIVVILFLLGIGTGIFEENAVETDATSEETSDEPATASPELDFGVKIGE